MAPSSTLRSLLKHANETTDECLPSDQTIQANCDAVYGKLDEILLAMSVAGRDNASMELSCEEIEDVWHTIVKLWVGLITALEDWGPIIQILRGLGSIVQLRGSYLLHLGSIKI